MNSRVIQAVAGHPRRWALAGYQLFVDFNLSTENLPPGARLQVGSATLEVTPAVHSTCSRFTKRFGNAAFAFVSQQNGQNFRGVNAKVVEPGVVSVGDTVGKHSL